MKNKNVLLLTLSFLLGAAIVFGLVYFLNKKDKVAYVNLSKLYNEFEMKKELEAKLMNVQQARKTILDSIGLTLDQMSLKVQNTKDGDPLRIDFERKRQELAYKQQDFDQDNQALTEQYTSQIWKQINQYVQDYAKANDYDFIFGGDGSGVLMYGNDKKNITEEVKSYINQQYKGVK
jgi:outer membrane protein